MYHILVAVEWRASDGEFQILSHRICTHHPTANDLVFYSRYYRMEHCKDVNLIHVIVKFNDKGDILFGYWGIQTVISLTIGLHDYVCQALERYLVDAN